MPFPSPVFSPGNASVGVLAAENARLRIPRRWQPGVVELPGQANKNTRLAGHTGRANRGQEISSSNSRLVRQFYTRVCTSQTCVGYTRHEKAPTRGRTDHFV